MMNRYVTNTRYTRNPNGRYPVNPFPMDYPKRSMMQVGGPPLQVNWDECRPKPKIQWHGYTGSIGYFPQPPMPSFTSYVAHNSCPPLPAGIKYHEIRSSRGLPQAPPGVPFNLAQLSALRGPEVMTRPRPVDLHARHLEVANSKLWRYDGRNYHFY